MGFKYAQPSPVVTYAKKETLPATLLDGSKVNIGGTAAALATNGTITKGIMIRVDDLGGGTYIKFGNSTSQTVKFITVGSYYYVDFVDSLSKIYVITDGANAAVSWNGG